MNMSEHQDRLSSLPKEALIHIVSFLNSKEVVQLSELNSSFGQEILPISVLHNPDYFCDDVISNGDVVDSCPYSWIPILFPQRTHSVVFTCDWSLVERRRPQPIRRIRPLFFGHMPPIDQPLDEPFEEITPWAKLVVVAVPAADDPNQEKLPSIEEGTTVYESLPLAPDERQHLTFSFPSCPTMSYCLWYQIGGRRWFHLKVENLKSHEIMHDYSGNWIAKNYSILSYKGFGPYSLKMLRTLAGLAQQEMTPETRLWLTSLLPPSDGFDTCTPSMKALEELASAMTERNNKMAQALIILQKTRRLLHNH